MESTFARNEHTSRGGRGGGGRGRGGRGGGRGGGGQVRYQRKDGGGGAAPENGHAGRPAAPPSSSAPAGPNGSAGAHKRKREERRPQQQQGAGAHADGAAPGGAGEAGGRRGRGGRGGGRGGDRRGGRGGGRGAGGSGRGGNRAGAADAVVALRKEDDKMHEEEEEMIMESLEEAELEVADGKSSQPPKKEKESKKKEKDDGRQKKKPRTEEKESVPAGDGKDSKPFMTNTPFASMSNIICSESLRALDAAGFKNMTQVQEAAIPIAVTGKDLIAKARTGTGKTLGFLIPSLEILRRMKNRQQGKVSVLVISPTRELAMQTMKEAEMLLKFHRFGVECVMGGTNIRKEQERLSKPGVDILVATPGRMLDHIKNSRGMTDKLDAVQVLVLDEADKLLEMGFKKDIDTIISYLPATGVRQTLLFSATMPDQLEKLVRDIIAPNHESIDTVGEEHTNVQVKQEYLVSSLEDQIPIFHQIVREHMAKEPDYKIIAFFVTARLTQFMATVFNKCLGIPVLEIHSRKTQANRTATSDKFRNGKNVIMFSSDVSARGVDYPDVTLVIQMGLPADKAQYIHRLGRTARAGKEGSGLLLLAEFEKKFLQMLSDLPITQYTPAKKLVTYQTMPAEMAALHGSKKARGYGDLQSCVGHAYQSWLGYYNSHTRYLGWSKEQLVARANELSKVLGCEHPPRLNARTVGKMGLKGVRGINIG